MEPPVCYHCEGRHPSPAVTAALKIVITKLDILIPSRTWNNLCLQLAIFGRRR